MKAKTPPEPLYTIEQNYDRALVLELVEKVTIYAPVQLQCSNAFNYDLRWTLSLLLRLGGQATAYNLPYLIPRNSKINCFLKRHFQPEHRIWTYLDTKHP